MKMSPKYKRLARALNAGEMRSNIQKHRALKNAAGHELNDFQVTRVFPSSDNSFTIQYRMNVMGEKGSNSRPLILCGHLLNESDDWPEYVKTNQEQVMLFEDLRLIIPVFPFDAKLPAIAELYVNGKLPPILKKGAANEIADMRDTAIIDCEVLGYRLEKRCVLKYTFARPGSGFDNPETGSLVTKISRPNRMKDTLRCLALLEQSGFSRQRENRFTVPATYDLEVNNGIQVSELAPGKTLHNLTGDKMFSDGCKDAALLLRKLHQIDSSSLPQHNFQLELAGLKEKINLISGIFPELAAEFVSSLEEVEISSRELDDNFKTACVHKDFYDKQILYCAERSTLLDCDSLACGDPAQDFGNFVAHLLLRELQDPATAKNIGNGLEAFRCAYPYTERNFIKRVNWWQAATLLRLAFLYSLRPKWHRLTGNLLNMANPNFQKKQTQMEGVNEKYNSQRTS